jgi:general secretion pathway protein I
LFGRDFFTRTAIHPGSSPGQAFARKRAQGFTLIEALVALAIIAAVLSSIGAVIGTTVKGTKSIDQRLALTGAAETVFAALPARNALKPGRQSGELAGHRWRIDVTPLNAAAMEGPQARFVPLAVNMRVQGPGGSAIQVTTVRLVPKVAE